ncbi:fimbrial protein [Bordetella sp. BOR01]|uniref:fimbrial protein n=1 Tax=Bordetella sp. BOR01 TaxID=2854779 RepID=UPI001C46CFFC|nr:fimbrial protein [Bordetella sp. BOR01]MBV7483490.1 fimbrial protein [Bordetella sp. BOR01]
MKQVSSAAYRWRRREWRYVGIGLVALWLIGGTSSALACSRNTGGTSGNGNRYDAYDSNSMQIAVPAGRTTFALPAYPTPGEVLFVSETMLPNFGGGSGQGRASPLYDCRTGAVEEFRGGGTLVAGHQNLYSSGVAGIAYRVYYYYISDSEYVLAPVRYDNTFRSGALVFPFNGSPQLGGNLKARIEFVATGAPISPGTLLPANIYGQATVSNTSGTSASGPLYRVYLATPVQVTPPTCDISNPTALTIRLPGVPVHMLMRGEGRDITATTLDVACSSPSDSSPTITLTANQYIPGDGGNGILTNQEAGMNAASGVGIQVWLHDPATGAYRAPTFGQAQNGIGAAIEALPSRRWQFKVGASYAPTGAAITAGRVRATATVKFTYI